MTPAHAPADPSPWEGRPFCGCPDSLMEAATAGKPRWPTKDIPWFVVTPAEFPGLTATQVDEAFALAWQWWADVCGVRPRKAASAADALVRIWCQRIDGPMSVLAQSELANDTMSPKRQWYDAGEPWVVSERPGQKIDLARVACHEIGHVLGIPHIAGGNLLAPTYSTAVRKPQAGDIAEAVARYGPPAKAEPVPPAQPGGKLIGLPADVVIAAVRGAGYTVT